MLLHPHLHLHLTHLVQTCLFPQSGLSVQACFDIAKKTVRYYTQAGRARSVAAAESEKFVLMGKAKSHKDHDRWFTRSSPTSHAGSSVHGQQQQCFVDMSKPVRNQCVRGGVCTTMARPC